MSDRHPFLSPEWIAAAREIRDAYRGKVRAGGVSVRMNQVITEAPDGATIHASLDTSSGEPVVNLGHLDAPDLTITTDYATAKAIFVNQDAQAAMQAFMTGQIRVEGDMAKLLMMQAQAASIDPVAVEIAAKVKAITS